MALLHESTHARLRAALGKTLPEIISGAEALATCSDRLISILGIKNPCVVADQMTYAAAGVQLNFSHPPIILDKPYASVKTSKEIARQSAGADGLIAVGSGTINDLCKYTSFIAGKPYAVVATAPSMNGYTSANASLAVDGKKQSFAAHLPKCVVADSGVLKNAPMRLIRAGLGDSLARPTAQADWLLAHLVFDQPYNSLPYELIAPYEKAVFASADRLAARDATAVEALMALLLISGFGMTLAGSSTPASGAEHMIAHTMEMLHGNTLSQTFHGEQIAVTAITMAGMQEQMLDHPTLSPLSSYLSLSSSASLSSLSSRRMPGSGHSIAMADDKTNKMIKGDAYTKKLALTHEKHALVTQRLTTGWPEIAAAIRPHTLPQSDLITIAQAAGLATTAKALGWNDADYRQAIRLAKYTRDRFSFLDVIDISSSLEGEARFS